MEITMGAQQSNPAGPDLATGIPIDDLPDGRMLAGHVGEDAVLLARRGNEFFAIGATCSHYGGPLAERLMVDDTLRCPWHHAGFRPRTGETVPSRRAAARGRRGADPPVDSRCRPAAAVDAALAGGLPRHHRARHDGTPGR